MTSMAIRSQDNDRNACVILGQKRETGVLQQILGLSGKEIHIAESIRDMDHLPRAFSPRLLMATDRIPGGICRIRLEKAKVRLKPRAIICLTKGVDAAEEIELRAIGLVFLGTYDMFFSHAETILEAACKARRTHPGVGLSSFSGAGPRFRHRDFLSKKGRFFNNSHPISNLYSDHERTMMLVYSPHYFFFS